MNPYLEKIASLTKKAFDVDFEDGNHYGIASNRSIGNPDVIGVLRKAVKIPGMRVSISGEDGEIHSDNPEAFKKALANVERSVSEHGGWDPSNRNSMNWSRDHSWAMSMDRMHPSVSKLVGTEDKWGETLRAETVIMNYVHRAHS